MEDPFSGQAEKLCAAPVAAYIIICLRRARLKDEIQNQLAAGQKTLIMRPNFASHKYSPHYGACGANLHFVKLISDSQLICQHNLISWVEEIFEAEVSEAPSFSHITLHPVRPQKSVKTLPHLHPITVCVYPWCIINWSYKVAHKYI